MQHENNLQKYLDQIHWSKKMSKKLFLSLFTLVIVNFIFAENKIISVDAKANISLLNGSISEYVFDPASHNTDDVLSRLDWDVKNVPIVSVSVDLTLFKYAYFNLGAGFGFPSTPSGNMQDYDWLNCIPIKNGGFGLPKQYGTELTNYSIHDNFLNSYRNIFVKIGYNFYLPLKITITPFVAYNYEYLGFDGFDGYRKYKKENWQKIEFSGNVISYFQETNAFLVGIKLISPVLFNLKIDGEFLISPYTSNINALDKHHIRKTHFMDLMPWSYQLQSSLNLSYSIQKHHKIFVQGFLQYIPVSKGNDYFRYTDENGNYTPTNWTIDKSCQGGTSRFLWQISLGYCFSI